MSYFMTHLKKDTVFMPRLSSFMPRLSSLHAILIAMAFSATLPSQAQTQNDASSCQAFSNYGGIVADFILPMSLRSFAALNSGKDQQIAQQFISKVDRELRPADEQVFDRLGEQNSVLFEEAATDLAINMVLEGHAASRQEVTNVMKQECLKAGTNRIIEFQRQSYQTESQSRSVP